MIPLRNPCCCGPPGCITTVLCGDLELPVLWKLEASGFTDGSGACTDCCDYLNGEFDLLVSSMVGGRWNLGGCGSGTVFEYAGDGSGFSCGFQSVELGETVVNQWTGAVGHRSYKLACYPFSISPACAPVVEVDGDCRQIIVDTFDLSSPFPLWAASVVPGTTSGTFMWEVVLYEAGMTYMVVYRLDNLTAEQVKAGGSIPIDSSWSHNGVCDPPSSVTLTPATAAEIKAADLCSTRESCDPPETADMLTAAIFGDGWERTVCLRQIAPQGWRGTFYPPCTAAPVLVLVYCDDDGWKITFDDGINPAETFGLEPLDPEQDRLLPAETAGELGFCDDAEFVAVVGECTDAVWAGCCPDWGCCPPSAFVITGEHVPNISGATVTCGVQPEFGNWDIAARTGLPFTASTGYVIGAMPFPDPSGAPGVFSNKRVVVYCDGSTVKAGYLNLANDTFSAGTVDSVECGGQGLKVVFTVGGLFGCWSAGFGTHRITVRDIG